MTTHPWVRFLAFFLPLALLGLVAAAPADAGGSGHPYFNDRGTLRWYHSFREAREVAQQEQKLIFVEYGRRACSNCRKLASNILPHSSVRNRISQLAIGLAAECDNPEPEVAELFRLNLRNANMLPFCAFVTPRGRWITGWAGYTTASQMGAYLDQAEARHRSIFGRAGAASRARPAAPISQERRAPDRAAASRPDPSPEPAGPEEGYTDADLEADNADDPCVGPGCENGTCTPPGLGGECAGGACTPPGLGGRLLKGVRELFGGTQDCEPCRPAACAPPPPVPTPEGEAVHNPGPPQEICDFPAPAPRSALSGPCIASSRVLPRPQVRPAVAPIPSEMPYGSPDSDAAGSAPEAQAPRSADQMLAETAAKRMDWATVLRLTRDARSTEPGLRTLNRQAHAWAHGRLAAAVRSVRAERYDEARKAMDEVSRTMEGEPESVDARRGMEAIEHMRDMTVLAEDSPLRSTVRKTAYEQMRGTRWAPLFSDVPAPSPALSGR